MSNSIPHHKGLCFVFGRLVLIEDTSSIDQEYFSPTSEEEASALLVQLNDAISASPHAWPLPFIDRNRLTCDANGWFDVA